MNGIYIITLLEFYGEKREVSKAIENNFFLK